jgi:UPF0755 protein
MWGKDIPCTHPENSGMQNRDISRAVLAVLMVAFLSLALIACVVGGGLYLWARQEGLSPITAIRLRLSLARHDAELKTPAGTDPSYHKFVIATGDTAHSIATNLQAENLITSAKLFLDYAQYYRLDSRLEAGTYFLQQTQTIEQIAYALTDASAASIPFRIIAGWRLEEVAQNAVDSNTLLDFSGADFIRVVGPGAIIPAEFKARVGIPDVLSNGKPPSLEGFMYADDYRLQPAITAEGLRDEILKDFTDHVTDQMFQQAAAQGLNMYQVVTLASIVQRETAALDEAPVVASVYLNRLRLPMRLDADPTVQYAIGNTRDGSWWPSITQDDYYGLTGLPNQSYSTYLNDGLPPGPIASPSLAAINAVLTAPQTQYYYFRIGCNGDGRHVFFTLDQQAQHANFTCP